MTLRITPSVALVLVLSAASLGCLSKNVTHVLTLEDDGSVTWTIAESGVRSASTNPDERRKEEDEYLRAARHQELAAGQAMSELGAQGVLTTVLRDRPPFAVVVEGRFDSVEDVARAWKQAGLGGELRVEGEGETLSVVLRSGSASLSAEVGSEDAVGAMLEEIDRLEIVPASGTLAGVQGLTAVDDGMYATADIRAGAEPAADGTRTWGFTRTPELPSK